MYISVCGVALSLYHLPTGYLPVGGDFDGIWTSPLVTCGGGMMSTP